jgi:hypothetical protein
MSPLIPADELLGMQYTQEGSLPDLCDILAITRISDGAGGFAETWTAVEEDVPCRLTVIKGMEDTPGQAVQPFQKTILTLPVDAQINTANRIAYEGDTYNVIGLSTPKSWATCIRVELEMVTL